MLLSIRWRKGGSHKLEKQVMVGSPTWERGRNAQPKPLCFPNFLVSISFHSFESWTKHHICKSVQSSHDSSKSCHPCYEPATLPLLHHSPSLRSLFICARTCGDTWHVLLPTPSWGTKDWTFNLTKHNEHLLSYLASSEKCRLSCAIFKIYNHACRWWDSWNKMIRFPLENV